MGRFWDDSDQEKVCGLEFIEVTSEPGELKHLSTRRKGHQRDSVSSGERTRTRPVANAILSEPSGMAGIMGDSPVRSR
jgi:hypothetical protein